MNRIMPGLPVHHHLLEFTHSRPSSLWCHLAISSWIVPFSSCPQSLPISESFPMSQLFPSGGQNIGVSASASVLPKNIQDWSPLEWTDWISLQSRGLSRVFSNPIVWKSIKPFPLPYFLLKGGAFKHDSRWSDGRMKDDRMDRMVGRDRYRWIEREYTPQ